MQAIKTRYLGHTATKPARIVASTASGIRRVYSKEALGTNPALDAAQRLATELHWDGTWYGGSLGKDDDCWVCVPENKNATPSFVVEL